MVMGSVAARAGRIVAWTLLCVLGAASTARADARSWLLGLLYESPGLFVPVLVLNSTSDNGRDWRLGVVGWTLEGELIIHRSDRQRRFASIDLTPVNADYSNYIYRLGRVDDGAAYRAGSVRAAVGVEIDHGERWRGRYALLGDYRRVRGLEDPDTEANWRHPFVGLEVGQRLRRVTSTEFFGTRTEGVDVGVTWRGFAADRVWSQLEARALFGAGAGPVFVQVDAAGFVGHGLDDVNAFLVGGSWSVADPHLVSGYRFGEFRLDRAVVLNTTAAVRLAGAWELSVRGTTLAGPDGRRGGAGAELRTVISGAVLDVGVAWPVGSGRLERSNRPVVYARFTAAILQR